HHVEAVKQAAVADRLVLTKSDMAGDREVEMLRRRLRHINPGAHVLDVDEAGAAELLDSGLYNPATKSADVRRWLGGDTHHHDHGPFQHDHHDYEGHHHHHADRMRPATLIYPGAIPYSANEAFVALLRSRHGDKL